MATSGFEFEAQEDKCKVFIPDGWYLVRLETFGNDETPAGVKFLKAHLVVIEGEYANQHIFDSFFCYGGEFAQSNIRRVGELAKATGLNGIVRDTNDIKEGVELWAKIKNAERNGKPFVTVKEYRATDTTILSSLTQAVSVLMKKQDEIQTRLDVILDRLSQQGYPEVMREETQKENDNIQSNTKRFYFAQALEYKMQGKDTWTPETNTRALFAFFHKEKEFKRHGGRHGDKANSYIELAQLKMTFIHKDMPWIEAVKFHTQEGDTYIAEWWADDKAHAHKEEQDNHPQQLTTNN